ncbi:MULTISPECIES: hypothetical protein [Sorangium]|uniref:hypothetical protein n=1 Tax=Sorangium TaxID=39643 RepID=UPI0005D2056A|nr:hypothetical protein [Sorangium cellulosum]
MLADEVETLHERNARLERERRHLEPQIERIPERLRTLLTQAGDHVHSLARALPHLPDLADGEGRCRRW